MLQFMEISVEQMYNIENKGHEIVSLKKRLRHRKAYSLKPTPFQSEKILLKLIDLKIRKVLS